MLKKAIIVCWIGKLPNYFYFWLNSAKNNKNFDFLLFTDQIIKNKCTNVRVVQITLEEINRRIYAATGIKSNISRPYKLCDIKPLYGDIFSDYLEGYDYWGHCDIDLIFGDLNKFVPDSLLKEYEKINICGHFILYVNNEIINKLYTKNGSLHNYIDVLSNDDIYGFDEYFGVNLIAKKNGIKSININEYVDIDPKHAAYRDINHKNYKYQYYMYSNNKIFHVHKKNKQDKSVFDERMYLHFQKKMPITQIPENSSKYAITRNGFIKITSDDEMYASNHMNKIEACFESMKYYIKKILDLGKYNSNERKIKIKQYLNRVTRFVK